MPSAVLTINTQQFDAALARSAERLQSVEVSSKGVEQQLGRMTAGFAGARLERELRIAASAVEKVGGVSRLTTAEQDRLAKKTGELLERYARLGKDAPAAVAALERELRSARGVESLHKETAAAAAQVDRLGGVAKMSASGVQQLAKSTSELIARYQQLGQTAPAALTQLDDSLRKAQATTHGTTLAWSAISGAISSSPLLAGGVGGAVGGAVAMIGTKALESARAVLSLAVDAIGTLITRGAEVANIRGGFVLLAGGIAQADAMIAKVRASTMGLVSDYQIMAASNKALLLGLGEQNLDMGQLAQTATVLGRAMGQDAAKSLDDLIVALGRSSPLILDNLGLTVQVAQANETYARRLGTTSDKLTDAQKKTAFVTAAMEAARERVEQLGGVQLTFADRIRQVQIALSNVVDGIAEGIARSPALNAAMEAIGGSIAEAFGANKEQLVTNVVRAVDVLAVATVRVAEGLVQVGRTTLPVFAGFAAAAAEQAASVLYVSKVLAEGRARLSEWDAALPLASAEMRATAVRARELADNLGGAYERAKALAQGGREIADGTHPSVAALGRLQDVLANLRERMEAASRNGETQAAAQERVARSAATAAGAIDGKTTADKASATAAAAAARAADEQAAALQRLVGIDKAESAARLVQQLDQLSRLRLSIDPAQAQGAVDVLEAGLARAAALSLRVDDGWRKHLETLKAVAAEHQRTTAQAQQAQAIETSGVDALAAAYRRVRDAQRLTEYQREVRGLSADAARLVKITQDYRDALDGVRTGQQWVNERLAELGDRITPELRRQLEAVGRQLDEIAKDEAAALDERFRTMFEEALLGSREFRVQLAAVLEALSALNPALAAIAQRLRDLDATAPAKEGQKAAKDLSKEWTSSLTAMARAAATFAEVAGDSFGGVAKEIATMLALMAQGAEAGSAIREGIKQGGVAGWSNAAAGGIAAGASFWQATDVKGRGNRALRGAGQGAAIGGAIVPGWGHVIGAGAGAIIGAARNPGWEQELQRIAKDFGVTIDEELARAIDKARKGFGGDRQTTEIASLPQIIEAAGGVNTKNVDQLTARLRDTFSLLEGGRFTADQARATLDAAFPSFAQHIAQSGKVASTAFAELLDLNRRFGTESASISQFVAQQAGRMGAALQGIVAPGVKAVADLKAARDKAIGESKTDNDKETAEGQYVEQIGALAAKSAPEVERAARMMAVGFNASMKQGGDLLATIDQFGPSIDQATALMRDFGIATEGSALAGIGAFRDRINLNRELVDSVAALNDYTLALSNVGGLADGFADIQAQLVSQVDAMRAAGFSDAEAFTLAKGTLETVIDAARRLKLPIDESTAAIIAQAEEAGVLEDQAQSMADVFKEGLTVLIETLGGQVPEAWKRAAAQAKAFEQATAAAATTGEDAMASLADSIKDPETWRTYAERGVSAAQEVERSLRTLDEEQLAELQRTLSDGAPWRELAAEGEGAAKRIKDALDRIPRTIPVGVSVSSDGPELPGFANGSRGLRDFGRGTLAVLHGREAVVTEPEYSALRRGIDFRALRSDDRGSSAPIRVVVQTELGVLAEGLLPHIGGRLQLRGLA